MRTFLAACACVCALVATSAEAALPPYHQRVLEFETILKNAEVAKALAGEGPIDGVSRVGEDAYEVRSGSCVIAVRVVTDAGADARPGPRRIRLELGAPSCR